MQKDPALRYQSVSELALALRAWRPSEDVELPEPEPRWRRSARLPLAMVASSALLALCAVGFWQTHGSAASMDSTAIRPMIAAAAAPIWRALPDPPADTPEPAILPASLKTTRSLTSNAFQRAISKDAPAVAASEVEPITRAPVGTAKGESAAPADDAPATTTADADATTSSSSTAVDSVTGRYGL
ncbi:MAG TPA: hypothetical protein VGJ91_10175, partial [Polyangiaceae bacterium]